MSAIDCLVRVHSGLPRDRAGRRLSPSGRFLILQAVEELHGVRLTAADLARDEHKRWSVPKHGWHVSVAHCADLSAVAVSEAPIGVDLQDERHRPLAMAWLGELLALPTPATTRHFVECESLIKASHITKETFAGVRLPAWRPGWRAGNVGHHHLSTEVSPGVQLGLAAREPADVRWSRC